MNPAIDRVQGTEGRAGKLGAMQWLRRALANYRTWTDPKRFEWITLGSLLFSLLVVPVMMLGWVIGETQNGREWVTWVTVALAVLIYVTMARFVQVGVVRTSVPHDLQWQLIVVAVVTALFVAAARPLPLVMAWAFVTFFVSAILGCYAVYFKLRYVIGAGLIIALTSWVAFGVVHGLWELDVLWVVVTMAMVGAVVLGTSVRMSVWMIRVMYELDQARLAAAQLAVVEERLRFSRDLHDVFGRTLSAVSVKSQVAAALASRADERAVTEMEEVQRLAADALVEVRSLVQGYRSISVSSELKGAASLLDSARIRAEFDHEALDGIPERHQQVVAWFIREGITNVVRHSRATACRITLVKQPGHYSVVMVNDGVNREAGESGSGLAGLAERLNAEGAALEWHHDHTTDEFTLTAVLPEVHS